jgi:hypothetical protein
MRIRTAVNYNLDMLCFLNIMTADELYVSRHSDASILTQQIILCARKLLDSSLRLRCQSVAECTVSWHEFRKQSGGAALFQHTTTARMSYHRYFINI